MDKKTIECPLCRIGGYPHFSYSGSGACDHCGAVWTYDEGDTLTDDSLRRLWEKVPRWIPVEERLPEPFNEYGISPGVLVAFADGTIALANCMKQSGVFEWNCTGDNDGQPTHWMPLPQPPEVTK